MESTYLSITPADLLRFVNGQYGIHGESIRLHRDSGGRVYYIYSPEAKTVFKLYRPMHTESAVQSTGIMSYLDSCGYPVVKIVPTIEGAPHSTIATPEGQCVGVLFEFAQGRCIGFLHRWRDGKQPLIHPKTSTIGRELGQMHRLMEGYKCGIMHKGRARYIDDLILLMRRDHQDEAKICDLEDYGNNLWAALEQLPGGFCHGDMHTGNTVLHGGLFTWMDFDRAAYSYPVLDVGWLTDGSDFNVFDGGALDRSRFLFDALYKGYSKERILTDGEIAAVFGCIAIMHYELISSIVIRGNEVLDKDFIDEQHDWLMRWRELCSKKLGAR